MSSKFYSLGSPRIQESGDLPIAVSTKEINSDLESDQQKTTVIPKDWRKRRKIRSNKNDEIQNLKEP